ncbi:DUF3097 domain-containing protein [Jatrophihabitans telluris]|uniref:DUF3097 domain-containing protein n=1 Tax=Jatrophihabitans telluris TaxID=2038343 RepID=A0ABY4R2T0_9ACTN|nr:DUF3097 domain-containing protein [Jatrophihabitans telluris]UQX90221.1 DUF3097 domain-containing protein [Jatrophihabitans telluris]
MRYSSDVLGGNGGHRRRSVRQVPAEVDLVVETVDGSFCGAVVSVGKTVLAGEKRDTVTLADRFDRHRVFPLLAAGFLLEGELVTLVRPEPGPAPVSRAGRTASGSVAVAGVRAQVAKASRIWVEGVHDAALVERIWGEDLRIEGIVVEPLGGIDNLVADVRAFAPSRQRRLGVLVDHLVPGSKESRIAAGVNSPDVLINGHPYVDVWQAVKPVALGIDGWPAVPRSVPWKEGVAAALGVSDPRELWRRVLASVDSYADVEVPLLRSVEELIDFVTVG